MKQLCAVCGSDLDADEIALYKKLVNRGADSGFLCLCCLAAKLGTTVPALCESIVRFRRMGCTLF